MSMPGVGLLALLRKKSEPEEPKAVDSPKFGARSSVIDALAQSFTGSAGKKQNQAKGRSFKDLESDTYTFDYDDFQPGEAQPELMCQPIARVPTEFNPHISKHSLPDRLIAVNDQYICYGLKQGHIRVLSRATGAKALLKGHNSLIADITIHPETNALAAGGKDGHLLVWQIQGEEDLACPVLVDASVQSADRVLVSWISDGTGLAVATGEHIGIISFGTDLASAPQRIDISGDFEDLSDAGVFCTVYSKHGTLATALACSTAISSLAVGYLDGSVHELSLEIGRKGLSPGAQARLKHKRDMFTGESLDSRGLPITFVYYISEDALVYGYRDAVIMPHGFILYLSAPTSSDGGYTADENVPFVIAGVVPESNLVILTDPKHNMFITVHYDESLTMDYIARFSVTMPVLSFTPHFKKDEDGSGGGEVEINTVQTEAVQQYMLSPELCYRSGGDAVVGGEGTKEETRAAGIGGDAAVQSRPNGAATATATAVAAAMGNKKTSESGSGTASPGPAMSSASSFEPLTKDVAAAAATTTTNGVSDSSRITPQPPPRLLTPADLLLGGDSPAVVSPLPPTVLPPPSAAATKKILKKQGSSTAMATIPTSATTTMRSEPISGDSVDALRVDLARYQQQMDAKFAETMKLQVQMMETMAQLVTQVKTELPRTVTKSVTTAFNKSLEGMSTDVAAEAAASLEKQLPATVAAGLAKPIQDSFRKTFEKQLVPAFENAVQSGFGQMNKTLSQGLDQHLKGHGSEVANLANQLKESLTLAKSIRMSRGGGGGGAASSESGTPRAGSKSASGGGAISRDVRAELLALAKAGRYEDAFVQGLSLQDVSTIAWLCSQVDAATVLNAEPLPLSQTVLLSLLQQVSAGMGSSGTSLSSGLSWVREAAIQLNPKDASVAAHVKPVLEQVLGSLQSILPKAKGGDSQACKLAMHVVKSQMM